MRLPTDHIQIRVFLFGLLLVAGGILVWWAVLWSTAPTQSINLDMKWSPTFPRSKQQASHSFDLSAFDIKLVPDVRTEPSQPSLPIKTSLTQRQQPKPPQLTLLGTVLQSEANGTDLIRFAIIYDIRHDAIFYAKEGQEIGQHIVESVNRDVVRIAVLDQIYQLSLDGVSRWEKH